MKRSAPLGRTTTLKRGKPREKRRTALQTFRCPCGTLVRRARVGAGLCRPCSQRQNAQRRDYDRAGAMVACETCGDEFYATPAELGRRKYCGRRCTAIGQLRSKTTHCVICGDEHPVGPPSRRRKTCGQSECVRAAIALGKQGELNPNYSTGERQAIIAWRASRAKHCALCPRRAVHVHHVVYEQHARRAGGDPWDLRDSLSLCRGCHASHHASNGTRILVSKLRPENIAYAVEVLGAYAVDYLRRYYDGDRLDLVEAVIELRREYS